MQSTASIFRQPIIWVAALGYFVDIYDLLLFSIIRIPSLTDLGVANLGEVGMLILNTQMFGLLIGGILWGVLGDKLGRTKVLFYSIALYSIGNIANGFVTNGTQYTWIRFFAGIGLAGELGAGITLVSELLPRKTWHWNFTGCRRGTNRCSTCLLHFAMVRLENVLFHRWRIGTAASFRSLKRI